MKKALIVFSAAFLVMSCSNSNTVNVPVDSNNVSTPVPHDTATNMKDSAGHADTSARHKM